MKIAVEISLSAAINAGSNQSGWQVVDLDVSTLTDRQRQTLAARLRERDGEPPRLGTNNATPDGAYIHNGIATPTAEAVLAMLDTIASQDDARREAATAAAAAREARIDRALVLAAELPRDVWIDPEGHRGNGAWWPAARRRPADAWQLGLQYDDDGPFMERVRRASWWTDVEALIAEWTEATRAQIAERELARAAAEMAKREQEAAAEMAKRDAISAWVALHGTESQRERAEAGLLPDDEIIDAMREAAFAPFVAPGKWKVDGEWTKEVVPIPRYEKLTRSDVPCRADDEHDPDAETTYAVERAESLTEAEWVAFRAIRQIAASIEGATVEPREHTAICQSRSCDEPDDRIIRRGALVTLAVGPFTFTREFAL